MRILGINNTLTFERRPKKEEEAELRSTINQAYKAMGTTDRVVITHGSCFPALDRDTFIGSPYGKSAREYTDFLMLYGFNGNQLGPSGELEVDKGKIFPAPYSGSAFAYNRLFIDLGELTTEKYGKILSKETYYNLTEIPQITDKNYTQSDFDEAVKIYDTALEESYKTFQRKLKSGQPEAVALNKEYQKFVSKHGKRLIDEGIFRVLSKKYGTDDFEKWENPIDADLIRLAKVHNDEAINRYADLMKDNRQKINLHKFEQFIITKQIKGNKEWRDERGFKYLIDERDEIKSENIAVIGLDDKKSGWLRPYLKAGDENKFILILKHRPGLTHDANNNFDLQLSGHTHAGQFWPLRYLKKEPHC